jgi:PAS domain S-box-containing protein
MEEGRIVRYQGTLVDVTEKRAMERQLHRQEEFRRHLLESFPDLILVLDRMSNYTFVSSRIRDLLGYGPENLLGKKLEEGAENSPELVGLYRSVASGATALATLEYGARHQDGSWRTMLGTASPMLDTEGKPAGVIISVRDVTTEKKLEQQIIQSERLAAMGQMIGGFAHELNNPLTSILGMTELLQDGEVVESRVKQLVSLHQQARRAAEIVQNLQYFARPPAPGRSPVNLGELIQRTLHLQAYPLRKSNITVDFLQEPTLPPVMADPNKLMQVFLNLILNADQAIRESRDKGTIRIRLGRNPTSVWVMFQDDGPGIAPDVLPHIFDPFLITKRPDEEPAWD